MTEAERRVCDRFQEIAEKEGWTVYPEVASWDLVCVWEKDESREGFGDYPQPGDQLAIEAKGRCRVQALEQCIRRLGLQLRGSGIHGAPYRSTGPEYAAIAAPTIGESFGFVARCMGIHTYEVDEDFANHRPIPISRSKRLDFDNSLWTPPVVPDIQAGQSSPEPLTKWRVKALKLCAILRGRGWLSTADFNRLDVSKVIWRKKDWIEIDGREPVEYEGETRHFGKYVPGSGDNLPDEGWEGERDRIIQSDPDDIPDELLEEVKEGLEI